MAVGVATNFQGNIPGFIPTSSSIIQLVNKPSVLPGLGFTAGNDPLTYPTSGTPATPAQGLGTFQIGALIDATGNNTVDHFLAVLPAPCVLVAVYFNQSVIENTSATTTLQPRKCTAQAITAGKALLAAALNLKTGVVANTVLSPALTATAADVVFAANDTLALDFTGAVTEYIGYVTFWFNFI